MKREIREREIQLFDLIHVAEEFVSGFVAAGWEVLYISACEFWGESREKRIALLVGGSGPSSARVVCVTFCTLQE